MKKIHTLLLTLLLSGSVFSCKEGFLEQQPVGVYNDAALATADGVNKLLIGAYSLLNGTSSFLTGTSPTGALMGSIHGGEAYKGSNSVDNNSILDYSTFNIITSNTNAVAFFQHFYNAVYRCNLVLQTLPKVTTGLTDAQKNQLMAETRFLRGHYHFHLKRVFGNVPFIDESAPDVRMANTDEAGKYVDIWPQILADFDFARKNLAATQSDLGRPNKWAGEAYYAKVLIYQANEARQDAGYQQALTILNGVIANGTTNRGQKYALLANYHDNFSASKENHVEWVWGVQHSANDGTTATGTGSAPNGNVDLRYTGSQVTSGPGLGRGFGFYQPTQWFVDHFRVNATGLPYLDNYATNSSSVKNDNGLASTDPFTIDTNPVDPRLDWSVGRRGIPYLDYGIDPGKTWIRDQSHGGPYINKKWWIYKREDGTYTNSGGVANALNVPVIRYADVLLMAAEMEARVGSSSKAQEYVNQVRNRMVQNASSADNWVKKDDGTDAAAYRISVYPASSPAFATKDAALKTILFERLLELGMEGHRSYDVKRFGDADGGLTDVAEFNAFIAFETPLHSYFNGAAYTRMPDRFVPIPQAAVDYSVKEGKATLKQNPGY